MVMKQTLLLLLPIGTLKSQGILNWETQITPKSVRIFGKVRIKVKASIILPYVGGAKKRCHMTKHNIGCRTITSSKSVKRNIGKNRKSMKMKLLQVHPPSSYFTLKLSVKQKVWKQFFTKSRMVSKESLHSPLEVWTKLRWIIQYTN